MNGKKLLRTVVPTSGLFHDPGKATDPFGEKVWKNLKKADPIRHEIISKFILERWFLQRKKDPVGSLISPVDIDRTITMDGGRITGLAAASWLVATHHRLLGAGSALLNASVPTSHAYTLINHSTDPGVGQTVEIDKRLADPKLLDVLSTLDVDGLDGELDLALFSAICAYGRLALILADHHVSKQPFDAEWNHSKRPKKGSLVANTERLDGKIVGRQGLIEHSIKVWKESRLTVEDVLDAPDLVTSLRSAELPPVFREKSVGRFSWQNDAVEAISARRAEGLLTGGFFCILAAGTGSGKTIVTGKIMGAAGDDVRYSTTLPLRSLTRQTGIDYRADLGLTKQQVATVIGGAVVDLEEDVQAQVFGSGDPEEKPDDGPSIELDTDEPDLSLHERLARHLKDDDAIRTLVAVPILVCTMDHLSPLTDMRRSRFITAALRMLTSDLVIDEADSYDDNDLVALGRLVFMAGMFGRRVILSSATLPAPQACAYLKAYREGYAAHAALFDKKNDVQLGLFSDSVPCRIITTDGRDDNDQICRYLASVGKAARLLPPIRIARVMARETGRSRQTLFPAIVNELVQIHELHGQEHQAHGKTISVQLVRFSHVNPCVALAQHIEANQPDDYDIKYVVYHSRYPRAARDIIEEFLETTLKRKDQDKAFLASPILNGALSACKKKGVIVVVIATAVLEIGRDVDFDAEVVEPCSTHSLIQVSGRVGRHRMLPASQPNVVIMPTSMRKIDQRWPIDFTFTKPGAEGDGIDGERYRLSSVYADDVLPKGPFPVTAALRLDKEYPCEMARLEHRRLSGAMYGSGAALLPATCSNERRMWMTDYPAKTHKFRDADPSIRVWFDLENYKFYSNTGTDRSDEVVFSDIECHHALLDLHPRVLSDDESRLPVDLPQWLLGRGLLHYVPSFGICGEGILDGEPADA